MNVCRAVGMPGRQQQQRQRQHTRTPRNENPCTQQLGAYDTEARKARGEREPGSGRLGVRDAPSSSTMRRICGSKPMSNMRSASSRMRYRTHCAHAPPKPHKHTHAQTRTPRKPRDPRSAHTPASRVGGVQPPTLTVQRGSLSGRRIGVCNGRRAGPHQQRTTRPHPPYPTPMQRTHLQTDAAPLN
jgi:hypothetical protein